MGEVMVDRSVQAFEGASVQSCSSSATPGGEKVAVGATALCLQQRRWLKRRTKNPDGLSQFE